MKEPPVGNPSGFSYGNTGTVYAMYNPCYHGILGYSDLHATYDRKSHKPAAPRHNLKSRILIVSYSPHRWWRGGGGGLGFGQPGSSRFLYPKAASKSLTNSWLYHRSGMSTLTPVHPASLTCRINANSNHRVSLFIVSGKNKKRRTTRRSPGAGLSDFHLIITS